MRAIGYAIVVVAAGCSVEIDPAEPRPVVATVSGEPIYADDFKREYKRVRLSNEGGLPTLLSERTHRRALLDDLITRRLILREAEKLNVAVGLDEVEQDFLRIRSGWTDEEFKAWLKDKDTTEVELKRQLRELALSKKYFVDHVFSRVAVTDQEIEAYLERHPETLMAPEQVRARQIVVKTEEQAREILREIRRGTSFADAAMQHSLSPEGKSGGDLGFFARGAMPRVFDEECFNLAPGQTSKVVASDYGFHIFQVVERREAQEMPISHVREQVEELLRGDKEEVAQQKKIEELRNKAKIEIREERLAQIQ